MPGTGLARDLGGPSRWVWQHVMPALTFLPGWSTPARSASPLASLAVGESFADARGEYVEPAGIRRSSKESYDSERESRLWDVLEDLVQPWASRTTTA